MPHRLEYYRRQADEAVRHSAKCTGLDRDAWLRIAAEWEKLHQSLKHALGISEDGSATALTIDILLPKTQH